GGGNITNYTLTIDDAIQACEVVPCANNTPTTTVIQQSDDKFDKLKKLKALLDSGAISQSEYNEQKKKLLSE
ncbi:MAG: SHOCT domain-containing protein, partial [Mucilaginibacter sp.]